MRRLLYVPIVHTESDMGSLAPEIEKENAALCGQRRWARHKEAVSRFWESIESYLSSLDATNLKIYQDGLAADGDLGRKIVDESARRGSKNYQIVLQLVNNGAEIRKTEDVSLLLEEYAQIRNLTTAKSARERARDLGEYRIRKEQLTKQRDQFIARTIDESLKPGEIAVLFIGAYHDVLPQLAKDIAVKMLKRPERIKAYFDELLAGHDDDRFERLARYVASSIAEPIAVRR